MGPWPSPSTPSFETMHDSRIASHRSSALLCPSNPVSLRALDCEPPQVPIASMPVTVWRLLCFSSGPVAPSSANRPAAANHVVLSTRYVPATTHHRSTSVALSSTPPKLRCQTLPDTGSRQASFWLAAPSTIRITSPPQHPTTSLHTTTTSHYDHAPGFPHLLGSLPALFSERYARSRSVPSP